MKKQLLVMRHGEATFRASSDMARELTANGRRQVTKTTQAIQQFISDNTVPKESVCIWASPYVRAQQTAEIIAKALTVGIVTIDYITPNDNPEKALERIYKEAQGVEFLILVTHMPFCAAFASTLTSEEKRSSASFATAECQRFECTDFLTACGSFMNVIG
jgi:phosphohistidine phosphatase